MKCVLNTHDSIIHAQKVSELCELMFNPRSVRQGEQYVPCPPRLIGSHESQCSLSQGLFTRGGKKGKQLDVNGLPQ